MHIGVLAFQGDVIEHLRALRVLGAEAREIRSVAELDQVAGLIIPGGESTVIGKFLEETGLHDRIIELHRGERFPIYGTCAGAILLAKEVLSGGKPDPRVHPLGLMDITVERNAYGRQTESFEETVHLMLDGKTHDVCAMFIRAPRMVRVGEGVEVIAHHAGFPVACRQGSLLVSAFHPELAETASVLHRVFLSSCSGARGD